MKYTKFEGTLDQLAEQMSQGKYFYDGFKDEYVRLKADMSAISLRVLMRMGRIYVECQPKWYDSIGEGVWCWVWDVERANKEIHIVISYDCESVFPFTDCSETGWLHAEPMTQSEVLKYVWKG